MSKDFLVCPHEMRIFVHDTLVRLKVADDHVTNMADMIVNADMRGHFGHGLARLEKYAEELMSGACDGRATPKMIRSTESTAWVDGNLAPGASVGVYCMHLAVQRARDSGAALVAVKRTGHLGPGAWYTAQALESGMIGLMFSSSLRRTIVPSGSRQAGLGDNRLCISAPAQQGDSLELDIGTCEVSTRKIRVQTQVKRGIPPGPDQLGSVCDVEPGKLLPLGGGSGLALLTEILGSVLASTRGDSACFIVLNPERFTPEFQVLLSEYLNSLRHLEPVEPHLPVLVPGDSERLFQRRVRREKGIRYDEKVIQDVNRLADELYVRRLRPSRYFCNCHTSIQQQVCSQSPK